MKKEGKKWAKGEYPSTSAGSMRRLLTTGVTVPFPVSTISNIEVLILAHSRSHSLLFGDCAVDEWSNTSTSCSTRCLMREDSLAPWQFRGTKSIKVN